MSYAFCFAGRLRKENKKDLPRGLYGRFCRYKTTEGNRSAEFSFEKRAKSAVI